MGGRSGRAPPLEDRDARLKAALKANMARRKAQARARRAHAPDDASNGAPDARDISNGAPDARDISNGAPDARDIPGDGPDGERG